MKLFLVKLSYNSTVVYVLYHTVLYSPKACPGLEDLTPPVIQQPKHPQPDPQYRYHQYKDEGGRDAAGLKI